MAAITRESIPPSNPHIGDSARAIVAHLNALAILAREEFQDASGPTNDGAVDAISRSTVAFIHLSWSAGSNVWIRLSILLRLPGWLMDWQWLRPLDANGQRTRAWPP